MPRQMVYMKADGKLTTDPGEEELPVYGYIAPEGDLEEDTRVYEAIVDDSPMRVVYQDYEE